MRSFLLTLLLSISFFGSSFATEVYPAFKWGVFSKTNSITTKGTSSPGKIKANATGDIFVFGDFGTNFLDANKSTLTTYNFFAQEDNAISFSLESPLGALYTGTGVNSNLYVYKMNKEGEIAWQLTSDMGDVYTSGSAMTPTADGGVFVALKVRHTNKNENNNNILLRLVDANGVKTEVNLEYPDVWAYQGVLAKISKDGEVEFARLVPVDLTPITLDGKTKNVTDGFSFFDLASDSEGYVYLGGTHAHPITFLKEDNTETVFTPHNAEGWDGDSQKQRGDLFLLKLNDEGKIVWNLSSTGTTNYEAIKSVSYGEDGYVYLWGNYIGDNAQTTYLGGFPATPTTKTDAFAAKVKTSDASVQWMKHFTALPKSGVGGRLKITSTSYDNGKLFVLGAFTGIIGDAAQNEIVANSNGTGNALQGFVLQLDPQNGDVLNNAISPTTGLSEFSTAYYRNEKVYAIGYDMAISQFFISYDENLDNETAPFDMMTASTPTSWDGLLVDNVLIAFGRGRSTITFPGGAVTDNYPAFGNTLAAYTVFDNIPSNIDDETVNQGFKVSGSNGQILIESATSVNVQVYNLYGKLITSQRVVEGVTTIDVPQGVYIVNGKKVAVF